MIVCDICKQELAVGTRFALTVTISSAMAAPRDIEIAHACSPEHFVIALARSSRSHARSLKVEDTTLEAARAELAGPAPVLPKEGPYR